MYRAGTQQTQRTQLTSHWFTSPYVIHVFCLNLLRDYDAFLGDLEEDKSYRQNINIYVGMSLHRLYMEFFPVSPVLLGLLGRF